MVDGLVRVVIPKLTDATVIVGRRLPTPCARIRSLLGAATKHTQHVFGLLAGQDMVLDGIVTHSACVPALAGGAL